MNIIWIVSVLDLIVYISLCVFWTYIDRNIDLLQKYVFYNRIFGILVMISNATLFSLSLRKLKKTLEKSIIDRSQTKILMVRRMMITMVALFIALPVTVMFGIYA